MFIKDMFFFHELMYVSDSLDGTLAVADGPSLAGRSTSGPRSLSFPHILVLSSRLSSRGRPAGRGPIGSLPF